MQLPNHRIVLAYASQEVGRGARPANRKESDMETVNVADRLEIEPTVEELELLWWEPLSCKCDIDFEE